MLAPNRFQCKTRTFCDRDSQYGGQFDRCSISTCSFPPKNSRYAGYDRDDPYVRDECMETRLNAATDATIKGLIPLKESL